MTKQNNTVAGLSLLVGSFLMFITMLLHPGEGGGLTQGIAFTILSHSLAILSVPFSALGFFGLAQELGKAEFLSKIAFSIMAFGLIAALMAATLNGIAMPIYTQNLSLEMTKNSRYIFEYNRALNQSFDFILIAAMFLSTFIWSIAILRTKQLPKWLGFLGIGLFAIGIIAVTKGFNFLNVGGFRIFIYGWAIWIIGAGISILKK